MGWTGPNAAAFRAIVGLIFIVCTMVVALSITHPDQISIVLPIIVAIVGPAVLAILNMISNTHASDSASQAAATAQSIETKLDNGAVKDRVKEALVETGVAPQTPKAPTP